MLASYLLIVLLIGLFLVWFWQTHLLDSEPVTALPELSVTDSSSEVARAAVEDTTTLNSKAMPKPAA
jgi:cytoskeleton protein RodZ